MGFLQDVLVFAFIYGSGQPLEQITFWSSYQHHHNLSKCHLDHAICLHKKLSIALPCVWGNITICTASLTLHGRPGGSTAP